MRLSLLAIALLLSACATKSNTLQGDYLTPSMLNLSAEKYDGQEVKVRGLLVIEYEKRYIVDSKKALTDWPSNDVCMTAVGVDHLLDRKDLNGHLVEMTGFFRRDVLSQGVIRLGACNITGFEINEAIDPIALD